ncbi:type II secretion system protein GspD [Candidatus Zixiibacteriota bacterium]
MRKRPFPAVLLLSLCMIAAAPDPASAQAVDLTTQIIPELILVDESLQDALFSIIRGTGLSHIIPKYGTEQDSLQIGHLHLQDISVADALTLILEPLGLTYRQEENFIQILPFIEERIIKFKYLASRFAGGTTGGQSGAGGAQAGGGAAAGGATGGQAGGAAGGAAGAQQLETELEELLTDSAILKIDMQSQTIFVQDFVPEVERLAWYIEQIDIPPRQVEIQVALLEIVHSEDESEGVDYQLGVTGSDQIESALLELPGISQSGFSVDLSGIALGGILGGDLNMDVVLRALATVSDANLLSKPTTVVLDGRPAIANLADQIPYTEAVFGQGFTGLQTRFIDVGIVMTVTPTILDSSSVQLMINAEFSNATTSTASGIPVIATRNTTSQVIVQDGDVMAIGGLFRESETVTRTGIPILSKIPIIKYLFSSLTVRKEKRELIILVSPRILSIDPPSLTMPGGGV